MFDQGDAKSAYSLSQLSRPDSVSGKMACREFGLAPVAASHPVLTRINYGPVRPPNGAWREERAIDPMRA